VKGAGGEAVKIHLADGSFYVLHAEVFARSGLDQGSPLDPQALATLLTRSERIFARRRALALLSRAAHTRVGLARKLAARGFSAAAVRHALARMAELGYLDDRAFAEAWLRLHAAPGTRGWKALFKGLLGRGVPRAVAEEALEDLYPAEVELEQARGLARGLSPQDAIRKLGARGFRTRAISVVLREIRKTAPPPREE